MDTKYFEEALKNWQDRNGDPRTWAELTQEERSQIMRDAQEIKIREATPRTFVDRVIATLGRIA